MCQPDASEASAVLLDQTIVAAADTMIAPIERELDGGPEATGLDVFGAAWRSNIAINGGIDEIAERYACFPAE